MDRFGLGAEDIVSAKSTPYRELGLGAREINRAEWIALIQEHPALIKRPLVLGKNGIISGFDKNALIAMAESDSQE